MMNECNKCSTCGKDPCGCGGCKPARYSCGDFQIDVNPYDPTIWMVTINGATTKVKVPKSAEVDTKLSTNFTASSLIFNAERHKDIITGSQLGSLINLADLRDMDASNADGCDLLVYNPHCSECGDGCRPKSAQWTHYHIPDAGDCEMEPDDDGYYKVLKKSDCGCIEECRLPVAASGMTAINYMRDSVPDDPDFPWYYGNYNDTINLHLADNAPRYFGKYALKITVNYGVQAIVSDHCPNYNFRSLVAPKIDGREVDVAQEASTVQGFCGTQGDSNPNKTIPWGTQSLRSSFTFIVPKGKEAALYHEYRIRTGTSFPNYYFTPKDGQKVPDAEAGLNSILYPASRLHALQVLVEPTMGDSDFSPVTDSIRGQLDPPVDVFPNPVG